MKSIIWTDFDLDGAVSALALQWANKSIKFEVKSTTHRRFRNDFSSWLFNTDLKKIDRVYILDIDCSAHDDLVDFPQTIIFDHHETHEQNIRQYVHARANVKKNTSCARVIYNHYDEFEFTDNQKKLIALADDYDSYTLKTAVSLDLNNVFWSYSGDKIAAFMADFKDGFQGFNDQQQAMLSLYDKKYKDTIQNISIYSAQIPLNDKSYKFVSTFCDFAINEVARHIIDETDADVGIIVNPTANTVNIRQKNGGTYPIDKFAERLCAGAGTITAAGGVLTDEFAQFSRRFKHEG